MAGINVDMPDIARQVTVVVHIKGVTRFRIQLVLFSAMIKLTRFLAPFDVIVFTPHDSEPWLYYCESCDREFCDSKTADQVQCSHCGNIQAGKEEGS